tara:strand:+ start:795 stop:1718 length:924 start_codon:yes stop_codon:yes gene_type:complete
MKIFTLAPKENWIVDRLVSEWKKAFPECNEENPNNADIIWLLAGWCWNHLPINLLIEKKVIMTIHHIVPEKFNNEKYKNFLFADQFVDCYHVPNSKTKSLLEKITKKDIKVINYWLNDNLWYPEDQQEARKKLGLDNNRFYVGSFQRDTEGYDLITPKLEKGPDIFCNFLIKNKKKFNNLHVLLGGWRRQYVQKRLESEKIPYTLFEKAPIEKINTMYNAINLYVVSSRFEGGPQSIIEASSTKTPIISTDVGIASDILSSKCILNLEKDFYLPTKEDIKFNYDNVMKLKLSTHGNKFIKLFQGLTK